MVVQVKLTTKRPGYQVTRENINPEKPCKKVFSAAFPCGGSFTPF